MECVPSIGQHSPVASPAEFFSSSVLHPRDDYGKGAAVKKLLHITLLLIFELNLVDSNIPSRR